MVWELPCSQAHKSLSVLHQVSSVSTVPLPQSHPISSPLESRPSLFPLPSLDTTIQPVTNTKPHTSIYPRAPINTRAPYFFHGLASSVRVLGDNPARMKRLRTPNKTVTVLSGARWNKFEVFPHWGFRWELKRSRRKNSLFYLSLQISCKNKTDS